MQPEWNDKGSTYVAFDIYCMEGKLLRFGFTSRTHA